jgi:hypothetical protein
VSRGIFATPVGSALSTVGLQLFQTILRLRNVVTNIADELVGRSRHWRTGYWSRVLDGSKNTTAFMDAYVTIGACQPHTPS